MHVVEHAVDCIVHCYPKFGGLVLSSIANVVSN